MLKRFVLPALVLASFFVGSSHAATPKDGAYREGAVIVRYREHVGDLEKQQLHQRHGTRPHRDFKQLKMMALDLPAGKGVEQAVKELSQDPDVEYAEPDYILHATAVPSDTSYYNTWGMAKIKAPAAWDLSTGSSNVVVAVIDSGIDYTHPDLAANVWTNDAELNGKTATDDDGNGYLDDIHGYNAVAKNGDPMDDNEHGTHVSGTIGAVGNNGLGVAGVNWNVKIMACKFLDSTGSGATSAAIACLQYVRKMKDRGVNIVATNNSWGGGRYSQALYDAIKAQKEILFVNASGNDTVDLDATPDYPASFELPNMINVSSTNSSDGISSFSNYGRRTVHVAAPGSSIYSTLPKGTYGTLSGTSMAAPHVTGLVALLAAKDPTLDWRAIRNLVISGGDSLTSLRAKTISGRRINVYASLTCLDSRVFSALTWPKTIQAGTSATVSALSINCAQAAGPVTVALSGGQVYTLKDDGTAPDAIAGDGIFAGTVTPATSAETFYFSSPAGSELIGNSTTALSVATSALPQATTGSAYSATLSATGGKSPYTWSLASGSLPAGISLSSTGVLSGTPSVAGAATFTVRASDAAAATATAQLTLTVTSAVVIGAASLPTGSIGALYSATLTASGGTSPYTWSVSSGALPTGVMLSSGGTLSGTPTVAGTFTFTVAARDAAARAAMRQFSIVVTRAPLAVATATLPSGVVGSAYSTTLSASGGTAPYTWSVASGTFPGGLALSAAGTVSGTPAGAGTWGVAVQVRDAAGATASRTLTVTVAPQLTIDTQPIPAALSGSAYTATLAASGGTGSYTWSLASGAALPVGITLASSGVLSGTTNASGTFPFSVVVKDAAGKTATRSLTVTVASFAVTDATVGVPYGFFFSAGGGTPPYTYSVGGGTLPAGLTLNTGGVLYGTATASGTWTFTLTVKDAAGATGSAVILIKVL